MGLPNPNNAAAAQPLINIPVYEIADEESIETIHQTSLTILQEIGMAFYDEKARELLAAHGAKVEGEMVYLSPEIVAEYIAKAPTEFTQLSRNPSKSVKIGGKNTVFAPVYGPPFVYDLNDGRRPATIEDFKNFVKLAYLSPYIHHSGGTIVEPNNLPEKSRHLDMLMAHILYSDKPFMGSVTSPENARDSIEMARIVFGEDEISKNPA